MARRKNTSGSEATVEAVDAEKTAKVRSIRMTDETLDALTAAKQSMGAHTMEETMQVMLNSFSMTAAQESLPERASEIAEFEVLARRLINAYTHSLILCHDAEERALEKVKDVLDSRNGTIAQLTKLQEKSENQVQELEDANCELSDRLRRVTAERDAMSAELDALKKAKGVDADIASRFDELQKRLDVVLSTKGAK